LPVDELVARYKTGASTYGLGTAYGVDPETIRARLREAGVELRGHGVPGNKNARKPGGPLWVSVRGYLMTYDREGKQGHIHRACWEACRGPIPEGWIVHHVNMDALDNRIENLACMLHGEHTTLHKKHPPKEAE